MPHLGGGIVDVDSRYLEGAILEHLVEVVHSGGRLLRQPLDAVDVLRVLLVHQVGQVTSAVQDHVKGLVVSKHQGLQTVEEREN
ncbi:hypothetical protein EB796_007369 [Bugula neritina]|uniref:Uncharacterized protein n=1 Tax=Bugula neritina TaxID=10212 RepID=A0A7J7K7V4_BUGNE|nr:hypothetical protein EB796_007369 [Bugula neritina]